MVRGFKSPPLNFPTLCRGTIGLPHDLTISSKILLFITKLLIKKMHIVGLLRKKIRDYRAAEPKLSGAILKLMRNFPGGAAFAAR
jgi:hypothetical protein